VKTIYKLYSLYYSTIGSPDLSRKSAYNTQVDDAIMKALGRAEEPLRYNELHRRANRILGHRIWIKTFNDHLKKLCEKSMVIRKEKSRYYVTYEVEEKNIDDYASDRYEQMTKELARLRRDHAELEGLRRERAETAERLLRIERELEKLE